MLHREIGVIACMEIDLVGEHRPLPEVICHGNGGGVEMMMTEMKRKMNEA